MAPTPTSGVYYGDSFRLIKPGIYQFIVEDMEGHIFPITEELTPDEIGYPGSMTLSPSSGTVIGDTAVNFDWGDVSDVLSGNGYYSIDIFDFNFNRIFRFHTTESNYQLAAGKQPHALSGVHLYAKYDNCK